MTETAPPSTPAPVAPAGAPLSEQRQVLYIILALIVAVLCSYASIVRADFISFDDNSHVYDNPTVMHGLSAEAIGRAFTRPQASLWVPLTWISFMTDVSLFGMNPGAMHAVNLAWHLASTILLFLTLRRLTGSLWGSAFVAALFGLHPINVESVAWVAERKDVLSTFFWFSAIAAYARYVEKPRWSSYGLVLGAAVLGLLSKPMVVTLPGTLLLLDFWPLNRWRSVPWRRLLLEKAPFFLLSLGASWMAFHARREGAQVDLALLPIAGRISNALISYVSYLGMFLWPVNLGVFYPHPVDPQPWRAAAAAVLLLVITGLALWQWKRRPYLIMGWLWYLGVLVPVLGLFQTGSQSHADRFTYVPQIGLFVAVTWLAKEWWAAWPCRLRLVAGAILFACALQTSRQVGYWMDGRLLFDRTIAVTKNNACAQSLAGLHYARAGDSVTAIQRFQTSLRIEPDQAWIWLEFGKSLLKIGQPGDAVEAIRTSLHYRPSDPTTHYQLGIALQKAQRPAEAIGEFERVLRELPDSGGSHFYLSLALISLGRVDEARPHLNEAVRLSAHDPELADAIRRLQP